MKILQNRLKKTNYIQGIFDTVLRILKATHIYFFALFNEQIFIVFTYIHDIHLC